MRLSGRAVKVLLTLQLVAGMATAQAVGAHAASVPGVPVVGVGSELCAIKEASMACDIQWAANGGSSSTCDSNSCWGSYNINCNTQYSWWADVHEDVNGTHIQLAAANGTFWGCSQAVYSRDITPGCSGVGQCSTQQFGDACQGCAQSNPYLNEYVYYASNNVTDNFFLRLYEDSYGNWRATWA